MHLREWRGDAVTDQRGFLYVNKSGKSHYSFRFTTQDRYGKQIAEQSDDLPAKSRNEARKLALAIMREEMQKNDRLSDVRITVDGVPLLNQRVR